jgi:predicted Zn finger-like uncharacterized protein
MVIECKHCESKFRLNESKLGPKGAKLKCSKCGQSFVVTRQELGLGPALESHQGPPALSGKGPPPLELDLDNQSIEEAPAELDFNEVVRTEVYQVPKDVLAKSRRDSDSTGGQSANPLQLELEEPPPLSKPPPAATEEQGLTLELEDPPPRADDTKPEMPVESKTYQQDLSTFEELGDLDAPLDFGGGLGEDGKFEAPKDDGSAKSKESIEIPDPNAELSLDVKSQAIGSIKPTRRRSTTSSGTRKHLDPLDSTATRQLVVGLPIVVVATLVLLLGAVVFLADGSFEPIYILMRQAGLPTPPSPIIEDYDGVRVTELRSHSYGMSNGDEALVMLGTVRNTSPEPKKNIEVVGRLRNTNGSVQQMRAAPLGMILKAPQIASLQSETDLAQLISHYQSKSEEFVIAPGAEAPFMVVLTKPPPQFQDLYFEVALQQGRVRVAEAAEDGDVQAEAVNQQKTEVDESPQADKPKKKKRRKKKRRRRRR